MEKRYQVFVSSTYVDLKEERQSVIQTLMEMDCIPAGMEMFPAADEDQFEFIKKVIDDCDYYLLLIGGRYGSITEEGISYTEMEFDYAVNQGIRIVALVHQSPENLSVKKSDMSTKLAEKLSLFRDKVCNGRMVKFWNSPTEIAGLVSLSMTKTIKMYPSVGWVRANQASQKEATEEILALTKQVSGLEKALEKAEGIYAIDRSSLSCGDDDIVVEVTFVREIKNTTDTYPRYIELAVEASSVSTTWNELYKSIAPILTPYSTEITVKNRINSLLSSIGLDDRIKLEDGQTFKFKGITPTALDAIKTQFIALGFITVERIISEEGKIKPPSWHITDLGKSEMYKLVASYKKNQLNLPIDTL